jgi:tetratricopeptide (TPR) repeat protein
LQSLGKLDDAAAQMDRSLSVRRDPVVLSERAVIALQQRNTALASMLVNEALKLDPNNVGAMAAKLNLLERAGDGAATLAFSDQMLKANPNNIDAHLARVRVLLKLQQDDRASSEVNAVLARSPNLLLARYYRAVLFSRAKNNTAAFEMIKTFPAYFTTTYPSLAMPMAQIAFDNGNAESGANILGTALSAAPDMLDVRLRLVAYHLDHQNPQSALALLAPVQNSSDPRVKEALARARGTIASQRPKF